MNVEMCTKPLSFAKASRALILGVMLPWLAIGFPAIADGPKPAVEMTSLFKLNMFATGVFNIQELDLVFAPEGANIEVILKSAAGENIQTFKALSTYSDTNNAFSRIKMQGYTQAKLVAGDYVIDARINNEVATRLAFSVVEENSSDPFATNKKVHFTGLWQKLGYLHFIKAQNFTENIDYQSVNFRMWGSLNDLPEGSSGEQLMATLTRDKTIIGHSKKTSGFLSANREVNRFDLVIFKPHDRENEANVLAVSEAELVTGDHTYQLTVTRQSDGRVLRDFNFQSKDNALVPMPRTELGYTPQYDYLAPRALVFGTHNYEFEPVYWMEME